MSCASCGASLPVGARFCPTCGEPVAASRTAEERRVVTVVFADLAGFTALAEGQDPEAVKELLDSCFGALVPIIAAHGGVVDKIIGDELMAVFGAPVAHEDDPERAVRAAVALGSPLDDLTSGLVLRVGVNTGEVLAGPVGPAGAYTVTGDPVNTAHRLVSVAEPGEVLVGERTWAATRDLVDYGERAPYLLRGKQTPVRAWSAEGIRLGARGAPPGVARPLVGRGAELAELDQATEAAFAASHPAVITVTGEPGIGKTRLALELYRSQRRQRSEGHVLWAACPPYGSTSSLAPLADLVRAGLGVDPDEARPEQVARVRERAGPLAAATGVDRALLTARVAQLLGLHDLPTRAPETDAGPTRARVVDELVGAAILVLAGLGHEEPTLVVLDDVQWADDAVLGFLERLPRRAGTAALVVLALGREELLERRPELATGAANVSAVPLSGLDAGAGRELLSLLLQSRGDGHDDDIGLTDEPTQRILAAAGGNPFLLEELVQYLTETGALVRDDGRWRSTVDLASTGLPDGARSLLDARLDALPVDERDFLQDAAIMGRELWVDAVSALDDYEDTTAVVARLVDRGLLEPLGDDAEADLAFRHVLTADVAYASVPLVERAAKHAKVARWLRNHVPEARQEAVIGLLAHHYERAVTLSRELDHTDPGLAGAAFTALVAAARHAERHDALRDSDQWYQRALQLGTFDADAALDVRLEHGMVLVDRRRLDIAAGAFEEVQRQSGAERPELAATAVARLGVVARLRGDGDEARRHFSAAEAAWRSLGHVAGEADTLRLQGWAELMAGRAGSALGPLERALDLERSPTGGGERGETLQCLGWCQFLLGDTPSARDHLWEAAGRLGDGGDVGGMGWCFGILGFSFFQEGRISQAQEIAANLLHLARAQGDPWAEGTCTVILAVCLVEAGDPVAAAPLVADAERIFGDLDDPWGASMVGLIAGMRARAVGETDLARASLTAGLATARHVSYVGEESRLLAELAGLEADAGRDEEAGRRARSALALVRAGIGDRESELRSLIVLGDLAERRGDGAVALRLLEEAIAVHDADTATSAWRRAHAHLALLRAGRGDLADARQAAEVAVDGGEESLRTRILVARAHAAVAVAEGRSEEARRLLGDVEQRWRGRSLAFLAPVSEDLARLGA